MGKLITIPTKKNELLDRLMLNGMSTVASSFINEFFIVRIDKELGFFEIDQDNNPIKQLEIPDILSVVWPLVKDGAREIYKNELLMEMIEGEI